MRRRASLLLAAALAAATLSTAPSAAPAAAREVDITPPAVGSCHDLTYGEASGRSDDDAPVECAAPHTTRTVMVFELTDPDWEDLDSVSRQFQVPCTRAVHDALDERYKSIVMSMYSLWWFIPTKAQRDAGASWVRCDVAAWAGDTDLVQLPTDGSPLITALPLDDSIAKCAESRAEDYRYTTCANPHAYRATLAIKYPHDTFPGARKAEAWAVKKCAARMPRTFVYEWAGRLDWRYGTQYALCFKPTTR